MRSTFRALLGLTVLGLMANPIYAYEEPTHEDLTEQALRRSVLVTNPELLRSLGLEPDIDAPTFPKSRSVTSLMRDGTRLEDQGARSINHFFDPTRADEPTNGALSLLPTRPFAWSSPTWTLEDRGIVGNEFSFRDVRKSFHNALTNSTAGGRNLSFVRTFESLGHIVHHLQDMAQPQHVRNDDHCGEKVCLPFFHRPSHFERYSNRLDVRLRIPDFLTAHPYAAVYDLLNPGPIKTSRQFWYTGDGKGIAEFTNRNFVSARTNFRYEDGAVLADACYGTPAPGMSQVLTIKEAYTRVFGQGAQVPPQIVDYCGTSTACDVEVFGTSGTDQITGQSIVNEFASSLSIFDPDLQLLPQNEYPTVQYDYCSRTLPLQRVFSLNRLNHESALPLLFPRAVGYSAGLINFFFRGDIRIGPNPATPPSPAILNFTKEPISGTVKVYYEANDGQRYEFRSFENVVLPAADPTGPTNAFPISIFEPAAFHDAKRPPRYTLVFTGDIGDERRTQTDPLGAVAGRQMTVVYGSATITDWEYGAIIASGFGSSGTEEGAVLANTIEQFRAYLRKAIPQLGCDAFTYVLPDWPTAPSPFTLFKFGVEIRNTRWALLEFPPSCSGYNGSYALQEQRGRSLLCPAGQMATLRPSGLPEPTVGEACFVLR